MPKASISVISPTPANVPDARRGRTRPLRHVELDDGLVLELGREVVGQHHLHLDSLAAQLGDQPCGRRGEPADPGQRSKLGRGEQHLHAPQRKPNPCECFAIPVAGLDRCR